jgi:hypothetical protein
MQSSLEIAIKDLAISHHDGTGDIHYCEMLFETGMDALAGMVTSIRAGSISVCQWLVREYHIDPFALATTVDGETEPVASSPFVAAARQPFLNTFWIFGTSLCPYCPAGTVTATIRFILFVAMRMYLSPPFKWSSIAMPRLCGQLMVNGAFCRFTLQPWMLFILY